MMGAFTALGAGTLQAWAQPGATVSNTTGTSGGSSQGDDTQWKGVETALGNTKGRVEEGGVFLISLPRKDLNITISGVPVKPDTGIEHEITFYGQGSGAIIKYELALLEREVNPVLNALLSQNLMPATDILTALHNHYLEISPMIMYMHGFIEGDAERVASVLHSVLANNTKTPFGGGDEPPGNPGFDIHSVEDTVGGDGHLSNGVLEVSVSRSETFREHGIVLPPAMQFQSTVYFQSLGGQQAIALGELAVLPDEADAVARQLHQYGITITALHNHELHVQPSVYYLHCFGNGPVYRLARGIRAGLNQTKSVFKQSPSTT